MIPHLTFYTDNLPENVGGRTNSFVIRILKSLKDDKGIHEHELVHVKQFWFFVLIGLVLSVFFYFVNIPELLNRQIYKTLKEFWFLPAVLSLSVHSLLYLIFSKYKLLAEVAAYKEQLKYYKDDRSILFAEFISKRYGLKITTEEAHKLLLKKD